MMALGRWLSACAMSLLLGPLAAAAPGSISGAAVSESGISLSFAIEGMNGAGISAIQPGAGLYVDVTSQGFEGTTPTTVSRRIAVSFAAAEGASPATVTLALAEPIHTGDTAVRLTAAAGAFSDGTLASLEAPDLSVTNGSALAYAIPACLVVSETLVKVSGAFYVDVYAAAGAYSGHAANFGIAAVAVTVVDANGAEAVRTTNTVQLIDRIGEYGWRTQWQAFRAGPFDAAPGGDWGAGGAVQGVAAVRASAYPRIGAAGSVRTSPDEHIFLDPANTYAVRHAVVDPVSGNNATGRIGLGDGGFSAATDAVANEAEAHPFRDAASAIGALQRGDGVTAAPDHGTASWSVVYLTEGSHVLGGYAYENRSDTRDGPVIVTKAPGAARGNVVVTGSGNSCGLRTNAVWLEDVRIAGAKSPVFQTTGHMYESGPLGGGALLKVRRCDLAGPGRTATGFTHWVEGYAKVLAYGISCSNAFASLPALRDSAYWDIGGDGAVVASNFASINNTIAINAQGAGVAAHGARQYGAAENIVFHTNRYHGLTEVQAPPAMNAGGRSVGSLAMTFNVFDDGGPTAIANAAADSWFVYHNNWAGGLTYRDDGGLFSFANVWVARNYFASLAAANANVPAAGHLDNHNGDDAGLTAGFGWSFGGATAELFADWSAGDYAPVGAALLGRWNEAISPYDAGGAAMPSIGAVGAFQSASGGGVDVTPPIPGALTGVAPFVQAGPLALAYSGASDSGSGLAQVTLWAKKGAGAWQATGAVSPAPSGVLNYSAFSGEGIYYFALQAADAAGNVSAAPTGNGLAQTILDATAPSGGTVVVAPYYTAGPIAVAYSGVTDGGSGVASVRLWAKKDDGAWADTGLTNTQGAASFAFAPEQGDGVYRFAIQGIDAAGNAGPAPSGAGQGGVTLDGVPPVAGALTGPASAKTAPVSFSYSGATDALSGIHSVELWVRPPAGVWSGTGAVSAESSGTLAYSGFAAQGLYAFALVARDHAGNLSAAPSGYGAHSLVYDTQAPSSGTLSLAGAHTNSAPISVTYSGVTDGGSGLREVRLWAKRGAGAWTDTGLTSTAGSGVFAYPPAQGDGVYAFALKSEDQVGNATVNPSGSGQASLTYDTAVPTIGALTGPASANQGSVTLSYTAAADSLSGLKNVHLWVRKPGSGWVDTGMSSTLAAGSFSYNDFTTAGGYNFAVQAEDRAGNGSASPSGSGQLTVTFDATAPSAPSLVSAPATSRTSPIPVAYSGASDGSSGLKRVILWAKKGAGGVWGATTVTATAESGVLNYTAMSGDAVYFFAVQSEDNAGNVSAAPSGAGQTSCGYDATAPSAAAVTAPPYASTTPIVLAYAADGDVVEARLWFKRDAGPWTDSGMTAANASGSFAFTAVSGDGGYAWSVQTKDAAGNESPAPSGAGTAATAFDTAAPNAAEVSVAAYASAAPVTVTYTGASDAGSGVGAVELWVKQGAAGTWTNTGLDSPDAAGSFSFADFTVDAPYTFVARTADRAGNQSELSGAPQATVVFDTTAPAPGVASAPASASTPPISVTYTGASDDGSGVAEVELWAKLDSGLWTATGLTAEGASGTFAFTPAGDGTFAFALQAVDRAGNRSAPPSGIGDGATAYDATPPSGAAVSAPSYANATPIALGYTAAGDVATAHLWMKKGAAGSWQETGAAQSGASGAFAFSEVAGDDVYAFAVQTEDSAGNRSSAPAGAGAASVVYDTAPPSGGTLSAPDFGGTGSVALAYSGVGDSGSGLQRVRLFAQKDGGAWTDTGLSGSSASGTLSYAPSMGQGVYSFALQGEDRAGNVAPAPSGPGLASTTVDTTPPTVGTLTAPSQATQGPVVVAYGGVADSGGSGLASVELWVRKGAGVWQATGDTATEADGAFAFNGVNGDGVYAFALVAEDRAGNRSATPSGAGIGSTTIDGTAPAGVAVSAPAYSKTSSITVSYSGGNDAGSGLKRMRLWVRNGGGGWAASALESSQTPGAFVYPGATADGRYYFYVQAEDEAGNLTAPPAGDGAASTFVDRSAPAIGALTAASGFDASSPIDLVYSGVNDAGSGVKSVTLWARKNAGAWAATPHTATSAFGSIAYAATGGDGTYGFALVAEDMAGNVSPTPSGEGLVSVVFDTAAPSTGTVTSPAYARQNPVIVTYSGLTDGGSGFDEVRLYVRKDAGAWTEASPPLTASTPSGSFTYTVSTGDGAYHFALRTKDKAGNESPLPTGAGAAVTRFDTLAPAVGSLTAPAFVKAGPASIGYTGASDAGSGLKRVRLWVRKDDGAWSDSGLEQTQSSGVFAYNGFTGDGVYRFALQAEDHAGMTSPVPSGVGAAATVFDTQAPAAGTLGLPNAEDNPPINVLYSAVSDAGGSGVAKVSLWVRKDAGAWTDTGLWSAGESGAFGFTAVTGDGTYFFALRVEDRAGNLSAEPSGAGQGSVPFDTSFTPGVMTAPVFATQTPIVVGYAGAQTANGETPTVHLWVRKGAGGVWTESGMSSQGAAGSFAYAAMNGDDTYYFALQAENGSGQRSGAPFGDGDGRTVFDTTPPEPLLLVSPRYAKTAPIVIDFAAAEESGSGVKQSFIWVKKSAAGGWEDTGLVLNGTAGSFPYGDLPADGVYTFYLQVEDNAGLMSPPPSDDIVFTTPP